MSKKTIVPVLLIIALSFVSYFNIFQNEFVWDDHVFILDNPDIRSVSNLPLFFSQDVDGLYRPLRSLHYAFVYSAAGKNEFLYHFNSLFLHTIISILVFWIIFEIIGRRNVSLLAALIFAAHPIHTGRVTNITAGFDLLGIFFMLLSFYLYIKYSKLGLKKYFLFSLLFSLIAVFASEEAVVLPLVVVLYEFCFNREKFSGILSKNSSNNEKLPIFKNNLIKSFIPYFVAALFYIAIRFFVIGVKGRIEEYLAGNFFLMMLTMLKVYVYYIYLLIFPVNLTLFRDIIPAASIFDFKVLISALILSMVFFFAIKFNKNKILFFSVFWFFIALMPFSNILPLQVFMAERYLYVPSIAFSLLVSHAIIALFNNKSANLNNKKIIQCGTLIFVILLLGFYVFSTVNRNRDFRDDLTLWSRTVATNPDNSRAHDNLGFTYERAGETEKALDEFEKAVKLQPNNFRAWANFGVALAKFGAYNESINALKKSIEIRDYHKTYDKIGLVYAEIGMENEAIGSFKEAIKIKPRYAKAHNDLATVYGKLGQFELALQEFNEAIRIDRDYADAHFNLGILLEFLGKKEEAMNEFSIAAMLEPENAVYRKKMLN